MTTGTEWAAEQDARTEAAVVELAEALREAARRPGDGAEHPTVRDARWLISRRLAYTPSQLQAAVDLAERAQRFALQCALEDRDKAVARRTEEFNRLTAATGNTGSGVDWARGRARRELTPAKRALAEQVLSWVEEWQASATTALAAVAEREPG